MAKPDVETDPTEADYRAGRFLSATRRLRSIDRRSPLQEVLFAECLEACGSLDEAWSRGKAIVENVGLPEGIRARAERVLAEIHGENSDLDAADHLYRKARQTLRRIGSAEHACETGIHYFRFLLNRRSGNEIEQLAAELEREVTTIGSRRLLCMYHLASASYHGSALRIVLAKAHAGLAESHLRAERNCWLEAFLRIAQSAVCYQESDFSAAIDRAISATKPAEEAGHLWSQAAAAANCAFLFLRTGHRNEAARWLGRSDELCVTFPIIRIGNLDTAGQLALLEGDDSACRNIAAGLNAPEARRVLEKSWYAQVITHTRIRLHRFLREWPSAEAAASQGLVLAKVRADLDATVLFSACRAEALAALNRSDEAIADLARALGSVSHATLPTLCELDRVMAVVLAGLGERALASSCLRRATLLAEQIGDAVLIAETGRTVLPEVKTADVSDSAYQWVLRLFHLVSSIRQPAVLSELITDELMRPVVASCEIVQASADDEPGPPLRIEPQPGPLPLLGASLLKASVRAIAGSQPQPANAAPQLREMRGVTADKTSAVLIAPSMLRLLDTASRIAGTNITVLITGETGTGKEVVARFIHDASDRKGGRFIAVNCSALPRDLIESQMFGHRRGAFTGAAESFEGVVKGAEGGTLFLDEVGDLPLELQPKFLRFLEMGEILPLGSNQPVRVNVRVVAATNANLVDLVAQGRFRSDLYYRLNGVHFALPPLRSRREEIPAFARHLLDRFAAEFGKGSLTLTREALEHLLVYDWPGNLRQLASELRRVAALAEKDSGITPDLLSAEITAIPPIAAPGQYTEQTISVPMDQRLSTAVQTIERTMIARALERSDGRLDDAARLLGISRKGLFLKRRRYRIGTTRTDN